MLTAALPGDLSVVPRSAQVMAEMAESLDFITIIAYGLIGIKNVMRQMWFICDSDLLWPRPSWRLGKRDSSSFASFYNRD